MLEPGPDIKKLSGIGLGIKEPGGFWGEEKRKTYSRKESKTREALRVTDGGTLTRRRRRKTGKVEAPPKTILPSKYLKDRLEEGYWRARKGRGKTTPGLSAGDSRR